MLTHIWAESAPNSAPDRTNMIAGHVLRRLVVCVGVLVAIYLVNLAMGRPSWHLSSIVDLDGEVSLPAWFSSLQLAATGILLLIAGQGPVKRSPGMMRFLTCAGGAFLFLSADEATELHERITLVSKHIEGIPSFRGARGVWVFAYGAVGLLLLGLSARYVRAWLELQRRATLAMIGGFSLIVLGGVVLEVIGYQFIRDRGLPAWYLAQVVAEESLEMLGGSILVYGSVLLCLSERRSLDAKP